MNDIKTAVLTQRNNGAAPLLMLHYAYDKLRADATQMEYITLDSVNSRVFDGPDMGVNPYEQGIVFSVAVAASGGCGTMPIYVGPEFWFGNLPAPNEVEVDLGDGNGWQTVPMGTTLELDMSSSSSATQLILVRLLGTSTTGGTTLARCQPLAVLPDAALGLLASRAWAGYNGKVPAWAAVRRATGRGMLKLLPG